MVTSNYIDLIPKNNEKPMLEEGMGILTINEFINRNKDKVDIILDLSSSIKNQNNIYNKMIINYLKTSDSQEIINYFKNIGNIPDKYNDIDNVLQVASDFNSYKLIIFIQNFIYKNLDDNNKDLLNNLLNDIIGEGLNMNFIYDYLLTDLDNSLRGNRYVYDPKEYLDNTMASIEFKGKKIYKISKDFYGEYDFSKNIEGEVLNLYKITNDNNLEKIDIKNTFKNGELNLFGDNELLTLFNIIHTPKIQKFARDLFSVNIINLPLLSQIYLFRYLISHSDYTISDYSQILRNNRIIADEIQQAFFAVSEDENMSKIILEIADSNISTEIKKEIFDKYNNLIDTIFNEINNQYGDINGNEKKVIFKQIIKKINILFKDINEILEENNESRIEEITNILENTQKDFIKSGVIFKELKENKIDTLDDLDKIGIKYEKIYGSGLSEGKKTDILNNFRLLYEDNYDKNKQGIFIDEMIKGISESLYNSDDIDFYLFYINDKPILSGYFKTDKNTGDKYFGGFNGASSFNGYSLGFWALEKILDEQSENSNINALILSDTNGFENIYKDFLKTKYEELGFKLGDTIKEGSSNYINIKKNKKLI